MEEYRGKERPGENITPERAPGLSRSVAASPVALPTGSPEYFPTPFPAQAVMFRACAKCGRELPSKPVRHGDPGEGGVSHGYCEPCFEIAKLEVEAFLRGLGFGQLPGGVQ